MTFTMWSQLHFAFIASPFVFAGMLYCCTVKKSLSFRLKSGFTLSVISIILLLVRNGDIFIKNGYAINSEIIPFQVCHFANFILFEAFRKNRKTLFALVYCLNLPAALLSILFANSLENYLSILTLKAQAYIWGHMMIVVLALWALACGMIDIGKTMFKRMLLTMFAMYGASLIINNLLNHFFSFDANYFYTVLPGKGTPMEFFFSLGKVYRIGWLEWNPIYLITMALTGISVTSFFYLIYVALKSNVSCARNPK